MKRAHCPFCLQTDDRWTPGDVWQHSCGMRVPSAFVWFPDEPDTVLAAWFGAEAAPKQLTMWGDEI